MKNIAMFELELGTLTAVHLLNGLKDSEVEYFGYLMRFQMQLSLEFIYPDNYFVSMSNFFRSNR